MTSTILLIRDGRFRISNEDAWKLHAAFVAVWENGELRLRTPPKLSMEIVLQVVRAVHNEAERELRKASDRSDNAALERSPKTPSPFPEVLNDVAISSVVPVR